MRRKYDECYRCGCRYSVVTPDEICAYLERAGWSRREAKRADRWAYFDWPDSGRTIKVPLMRGASDYQLRLLECLHDLRAFEKRPIVDIARDMLPAQERIEHAENEMLRWGESADALKREASP